MGKRTRVSGLSILNRNIIYYSHGTTNIYNSCSYDDVLLFFLRVTNVQNASSLNYSDEVWLVPIRSKMWKRKYDVLHVEKFTLFAWETSWVNCLLLLMLPTWFFWLKGSLAHISGFRFPKELDCQGRRLGGDFIGTLPNRPSCVTEGKEKHISGKAGFEGDELDNLSFGGEKRNNCFCCEWDSGEGGGAARDFSGEAASVTTDVSTLPSSSSKIILRRLTAADTTTAL